MKHSLLVAAIALAAGSLVAADAKDEVTKAAAKLGQQPNYAWTATVAVPENARFRMGPTEGATEKGGATLVTMSFGENKMQFAMKGDKRAALNREGEWQAASEMENAEGPGRWLGAMLRNYKAPAEQAAEIAGYVKDLKKEGDAYTGTLSEEGVKALVSLRRRSGDEAPTVSNPSGSAKFWVQDGMLSKYEFQVKGSMNFNGNDTQVDRTTTVVIKDIGKAKVSLPEAATKKLS